MIRSSAMKYLSSWWTTAGLVLACAATYIFFLFGTAPYADWTTFLFHKPAGILLYCALPANILLASVRIAIRHRGRPHITLHEVRKMDAFATRTTSPSGIVNELEVMMKGNGFTVTKDGTVLHAKANQYSFVPGTIVRVGTVVLLAATFLSVHTRRSAEHILHAGDTMASSGNQLTVESMASDLPARFLQVGEENAFRLERVQALLKSSGTTDTITSGFPAYISGKYYRIRHFGITLPVTVRGRPGDAAGNIDLDVLPPGTSHSVQLTSPELSLTFNLQPERTITKGLLKGKEYNLASPTYHVVVQRGSEKEKIGEFDLAEGSTAENPSVSITLGSHSFYCTVQEVSDPALPFVYAGALLILFGSLFMLSRFFWYEKELAAVLEGDVLHIGYREEFFKKWGVEKFQGWMKELRGGEEA